MHMGLSAKQQRFVEEYLVDLNATQAAIRAGYSKRTAHVIGPENLAKPEIQGHVAEARAKLAEKTGVSAQRVIEEYRRIAFANMRDFAHWSGQDAGFIDSETLTDEQHAVIAEVAAEEIQVGAEVVKRKIKLKLHDKMKALDALSKHLGLFAPGKIELTNPDGSLRPMEIVIKGAEFPPDHPKFSEHMETPPGGAASTA
jgi:phage terminase small subunit